MRERDDSACGDGIWFTWFREPLARLHLLLFSALGQLMPDVCIFQFFHSDLLVSRLA